MAADPATQRQVKRAEAAFNLMPDAIPTYDHFTPAASLIRNTASLGDDRPEVMATLARAEKIFKTFNEMLE